MKIFPNFDLSGPSFDGVAVTVTLEAETVCGPIIRATQTITARSQQRKDLNGAATAAEFGAKQRLNQEHNKVVDRCKNRGTHNHGR